MGKNNKFSLTTKSHLSTRVNPYDKITLNALNVSCPDKQIVLPKLDSNGTQLLSIELYSLLIFIVASGTQYLNLYRSVWWLSKARSNSAINLHLIDSDVTKFSLVFIGQSALITLLKTLFNRASLPNKLLQSYLAVQNHGSNNNNNNHQQQLSQTLAPEKQQPYQTSPQTSSSTNSTSATSQSSCATLETFVTATASWICNYYLFKFAYRIWNNFGFNGLSCVSYPIVSIKILAILIFVLVINLNQFLILDRILSSSATHIHIGCIHHSKFNSYYPGL